MLRNSVFAAGLKTYRLHNTCVLWIINMEEDAQRWSDTQTHICIQTHKTISTQHAHTYTDTLCVCAQAWPTPWDSMDCNPLGFSVHGISQAKILEWVAISFSGGSSWPRNWTCIPSIADGFFHLWAKREAHIDAPTEMNSLWKPVWQDVFGKKKGCRVYK